MALTLISTHTASASATLDITSGITDTYDSYEFHFVNMHPATDNVSLTFQVNATDGADYNDSAIVSTYIAAYHREDGVGGYLIYEASYDQHSTAYQMLMDNLGNVSDESASGVLTLYAPSSTTYVKNFSSTLQAVTQNQYSRNTYVGGYINDTTAIDNISFKMSSGNIDAGTIKMFGVS